MCKILVSIKPEYVERILNGEKKFEYRKKLANNDIDTIIIYATSPVMKIVGEVKVEGKMEMAPTSLWENTKKSAGITREKYREYFKKSKKAYAYKLGEVTAYMEKRLLSDIEIEQAPQSFIYLTDEQYKELQ